MPLTSTVQPLRRSCEVPVAASGRGSDVQYGTSLMPAVPWLFHLPQQFLSGKPLGTRYKPCKTASEGIFAPGSNGRPCVSSPLHPEGSRYWHGQSDARSSISPTTSSHTPQHDQTASKSFTNHSAGLCYAHTSSPTSVSPTPPYPFPPRHPS